MTKYIMMDVMEIEIWPITEEYLILPIMQVMS